MRLAALALCAATVLAGRLSAATLHVRPEGPLATVQAGIDSAAAGDTLLLAPGTFIGNPNIVRKDLVLRAEEPGRTVLDADHNGVAALRVVSSVVRVDGVVLQNGIVPFGAGVFQIGGHVELRRCTVQDNQVGAWAYRGTPNQGTLALFDCEVLRNGIGVEGAIDTRIERTRVEGNGLGVRCSGVVDFVDVLVAGNGGAGLDNAGAVSLGGCSGRLLRCIVRENWSNHSFGGVWVSFGPIDIEACQILNNVSTGGPAGLGIDQVADGRVRTTIVRGNRSRGAAHAVAGLLVLRSTLLVEDCILQDNDSQHSGGGLVVRDGSNVEMARCRLQDNRSQDTGGGAWVLASQLRARDLVVVGNQAATGGAMRVASGATLQLEDATIAGNRAALVGGVLAYGAGASTLERTIVAHNTGAAAACLGELRWHCCITWGNGDDAPCGQDGGGNRRVDPLFCAVAGETRRWDLRLQAGSPAAGGDCGRIGAEVVGCGNTAVQSTTWTALKHLYRGVDARP